MDKARIVAIKDCDIFQGEGLSVSVWFGGCKFHCEGCFNKETWSLEVGDVYTDEIEAKILNLLTKHPNTIKNLSILGGEPLLERNYESLCSLILKAKPVCKDIWLWTGYEFEDIAHLDFIKDIDYVVCGQYVKELHKPTIYCGSSNQRIIDVKASLNTNMIVEIK